jgi:hypothetical protein
VQGTHNLHLATQDSELDLFALFSSIASAWGSPSLAHYAAANSYLDAMARYRVFLGKPALSVNWGMWADSTMVNEQEGGVDFRASGLGALSIEQSRASRPWRRSWPWTPTPRW